MGRKKTVDVDSFRKIVYIKFTEPEQDLYNQFQVECRKEHRTAPNMIRWLVERFVEERSHARA
jgi:hypothetical protein